MKKVFITIICSVFIFGIMVNSVFAEPLYTIEDIVYPVDGLIQLTDEYYMFEYEGNEYFFSNKKNNSGLYLYNKPEFDFFVKEKGHLGYKWTGEYYMDAENEWKLDRAFFADEWKQYRGVLKFYDKDFNLVSEAPMDRYISEYGYYNGVYYCDLYAGDFYTMISTDRINWKKGEIDIKPETYSLNGFQYTTDTMSFDGENFINVEYEVGKFYGEIGNGKLLYVLRKTNSPTNLYGISKDNIYYVYIPLNIGTPDNEYNLFYARKTYIANGYLYLETNADKRIKISLNELNKKLDAMADAPYVMYNDEILGFKQPPVIEDGRTLIPIRFLFEQMGATVDWNGETQTATITQNNTAVALSIDDTEADVNGQTVSMDVPAKLINDKTMVPVRFLSENLGYTVDWDEENRIITIE